MSERAPQTTSPPVLWLARDGTVREANDAAHRAFGVAALAGRRWTDLCPSVTDALWSRIVGSRDAVVVAFDSMADGAQMEFTHLAAPENGLVCVIGADVAPRRAAERSLAQSEKMARLGMLTAGVAHELNNPAAATRRAAEQLREAFVALEAAHRTLDSADVTGAARSTISVLEEDTRERAISPGTLDALSRADRESEIEEWLDAHGVREPWALAAPLVDADLGIETLERLERELDPAALQAALAWLASVHRVTMLVNEIAQGAGRIAEIVSALKSHSYAGAAPMQRVDVRDGINNTLIILRSKLKDGVTVVREFASDLPTVPAYGTELNQVWTNILDNAVDAMQGRGKITIRTRRAGDAVVVEIEDDGPGIPAEVRPRIFDPFFTTKAPGVGTGLGMATSLAIVADRHRGTLEFDSRPGRTCFRVTLPTVARDTASASTGAPLAPGADS